MPKRIPVSRQPAKSRCHQYLWKMLLYWSKKHQFTFYAKTLKKKKDNGKKQKRKKKRQKFHNSKGVKSKQKVVKKFSIIVIY